MRQLCTFTIATILVAVAGQSAAQFHDDIEVYETQDEQGVPSYSNIPSQGARSVTIAPTNSADSVEIISQPEPAAPEAPPVVPERGTPEYEQKIQRQLEDYRQSELEIRRERHGPSRHTVGTGTDAQRREVGDGGGNR